MHDCVRIAGIRIWTRFESRLSTTSDSTDPIAPSRGLTQTIPDSRARQEDSDEPPRKERPTRDRRPAIRRPDSHHRHGGRRRDRAGPARAGPAALRPRAGGPPPGSRSPDRLSPTVPPRPSPRPANRRRRPGRSRPAARRPGRPVPGAGGSDGRGPRSRPDARPARATAAASSPSGLKRGVGYRLRIANIPERPGVEVFPVVEVVGHLHRPEGIDPGKYPIRVDLHVRRHRRGAQPGPPRHQGDLSRGPRPGAAVPHAQGPDPGRVAQPGRAPAAGGRGAGTADGDRADRRPASHARGGPGRAGRPRAGLRRRAWARRRAPS